MKKIAGNLISALYTAWIFVMFVLPLPLVLLVHIVVKIIPQERRLRVIYRVHRRWIGFWEFMTGLHFKVQHHDRVQKDQAYMFVVNHINLLDIPMVGSCIQHTWKSLAKKEILAIPLVGWLIGQIAVMVDRSSKDSRRRSVLQMVRELKGGISILVFPEGTRNRTSGPMKTFHQGAFSVAISAQVPIMPVIITHTRRMQPIDTMKFFPGTGYLTFLPPISTKNYKEEDLGKLMNEVKMTMENYIMEHDPHFQTEKEEMKG